MKIHSTNFALAGEIAGYTKQYIITMNFLYTIDSSYIVIQYNMLLHRAL